MHTTTRLGKPENGLRYGPAVPDTSTRLHVLTGIVRGQHLQECIHRLYERYGDPKIVEQLWPKPTVKFAERFQKVIRQPASIYPFVQSLQMTHLFCSL